MAAAECIGRIGAVDPGKIEADLPKNNDTLHLKVS